MNPQIRLGCSFIRAQFTFERFNGSMDGLMARHCTRRLERLVARIAGKRAFIRVGPNK